MKTLIKCVVVSMEFEAKGNNVAQFGECEND
jgi:hypothetical protein